jgi:cell division protein FtsL
MNPQYIPAYENEKRKKIEQSQKFNVRTNIFLKITVVTSIVVAVSTLYLWQISLINNYRTSIARNTIIRKELEQKYNNLNILIAKLSSIDRIKSIAEEELNMVKSSEIEFFEVTTFE